MLIVMIITHVPPIVVILPTDVVILRFTVLLPLVRLVHVIRKTVANILMLYVMIKTLAQSILASQIKGAVIAPLYVMIATYVRMTIVVMDIAIMMKSNVMITTLVPLILVVKFPEFANISQ